MAISSSRISYSDCYEHWDAAVADSIGLRIRFTNEPDAWRENLRLNKARRIDRDDNKKIYPVEHPMHAQSIYDQFSIRKRQEGEAWFLYITRKKSTDYKSEPLSQLEQANGVEQSLNSDSRELEVQSQALSTFKRRF